MKLDKFNLTYIDTETNKVGINPDIKLLDLIKLTNPEDFEKIEDKDAFLADINKVNELLQRIYLRDNKLRWMEDSNNLEVDAIVDNMPYLQPLHSSPKLDVDVMIFPGSTGLSMTAIAATAREAILSGVKVKNIAVLGCEQAWQSEWVKQVRTIFELRPDLLREEVDLEKIDFDKSYTEHGVNALITSLIDFGQTDIHFEFLPVPMKKIKEGELQKPNSDDEAKVFASYDNKLLSETGKTPTVTLVSLNGFHIRQYYSYLLAGIPASSLDVLVSNPTILGQACAEKFKGLVYPNTKAKLDNLAKTIYQIKMALEILFPELSLPQVVKAEPVYNASSNRFSFANSLGSPMATPQTIVQEPGTAKNDRSSVADNHTMTDKPEDTKPKHIL